MMLSLRRAASGVVVAGLLGLAGCGLSEADRALITDASSKADAAAAAANRAADAAAQAQAAAQQASSKADQALMMAQQNRQMIEGMNVRPMRTK